MAAKKFPGVRFKSLDPSAVLSLREVKLLPQVDPTGTYPIALTNYLRMQLGKRRGIVPIGTRLPILHPLDNPPVDPTLFVLVLQGVVSWRRSQERIRLERFMSNTLQRCERRATQRGFQRYAEQEQLSELSKLFGPAKGARWIAHLLWGFALKQNPTRPSLLYLKDLARFYDWHVHHIARKASDRSLDQQFKGWRASVYTLRAQDRQHMNGASIQHFDTLFTALSAKRGVLRRE